MEAYENRIINGLLKAGAIDEPEKAVDLLRRDVDIFADPRRATEDDLWPALWALAAILERQFFGMIRIHAGLSQPLRQPARLSPRCQFLTDGCSQDGLAVRLGGLPNLAIGGDARGNTVHYGSISDSSARATPLSCFALAGYLGFAALGLSTGIPTYRKHFSLSQIDLPCRWIESPILPLQGLEFIGLGHLGQAYLALLFFIAPALKQVPRVQLLDKDIFEGPNWSTQILIEHEDQWIGLAKSHYLGERTRNWGWDAVAEVDKIIWGWTRRESHSEFAVLGLDEFEVRRMAIAGGYSWVFDAGLGDSFLHPRLSWHSIPADNLVADALFRDRGTVPTPQEVLTQFTNRLKHTPGGCGLLTYQAISASAPSLGLVAAAFLWSEILSFFSGAKERVRGTATVWSPILPPLRTLIPV